MSFIETPEFASRFNYLWHSNPKSKLKCKALFDKVHLRPLVSEAWERYKNLNNDKDVRDLAWSVIEKYDSRLNGQDNSAMCGGRTVQEAADSILIDNIDPGEAIDKAIQGYNKFKARTWDNGTDAEKKAKYIDEIADVTNNAVAGLKEAMSLDNSVLGEVEYIEKLSGIELPHNTRPDYNRRGDLKTKWSRLSKTSKSGFAAASLPKTLTGPFEQAALYQVAGFWACNGGLPPFLVYANASDYRIFDQSNTPELQDDYLHGIVQTIIRSHKATEELLKVAINKDHLFKLIEPDFSHICWSEPPVIIEEAKSLWGIS